MLMGFPKCSKLHLWILKPPYVAKQSRIVKVVFMNYSAICISFIKYVIFPCFDIFWFIYFVCKCLSILEFKGWQFPPSSRKFLELGVEFEQLDFPGICCFLQSSLDLETLVIDWYDVEPRVSFFLTFVFVTSMLFMSNNY